MFKLISTWTGVVHVQFQGVNLESISGIMACFTACFSRKATPSTTYNNTFEEGTYIFWNYSVERKLYENHKPW